MLVTPSTIIADVNPLQPSNAKFPTYITLDGIVTVLSPLQPENTEFPTLVVPSEITKFVTVEKSMPHFQAGTTTFFIALQL